MNNKISQMRRAGVLLHPTSLPSGQLDNDAFEWLDFIHHAGLSVWQMLPLGVPQSNLSPYQCDSAFAINPALLPSHENVVIAAGDDDYARWLAAQDYWLTDYALFVVLKQSLQDAAWYEWPEQYKNREVSALAAFSTQHAAGLSAICQQQYHLYRIWQNIRSYARDRDILLLGDMPIFVAHDSADVWANRQGFLLDDNGYPTLVAGVPPDYFSDTGQRWGNPHYDWDYMKAHQFDWWIQRIDNHFEWFDWVRIDHFRGLQASWMIEADCDTAIEGYWSEVPGDELLATLQEQLGELPLVAEDLGVITPEVVALRKKYHLPGMAVLQFSFDESSDNPHKPENIEQDTVAYSGTHDNDTSKGWYLSLPENEQQYVQQKLGLHDADADQVTIVLVEQALATLAGMVIIPLQDFMLLDSSSRMNTPGVVNGNWQWQLEKNSFDNALAGQIQQMLACHGRLLDTQEINHVK